MQNNKVLKEFLEYENNSDTNYKAIISKVKEKKNMKKKILNIAAVVLIIIVIGVVTPTVYAQITWNKEFKEYQNRDKVSGWGTVNEAIDDGYEENINMDYIYKDGIGIKIDSLMITDDYYQMNINIKLNDNTIVNPEMFTYGYAIYDEDKNVYTVSERVHWGDNNKSSQYYKKFYKEIGVKYDKSNVFDNCLSDTTGTKTISATKENIISQLSMSSYKGFPKSKKIYIRIFDLGYSYIEKDNENNKVIGNIQVSDAEWDLEINVPARFYERDITELKLSEEVPNIKLIKAEISETGLIINADIDGLADLIMSGKDMETQEFNDVKNNAIFVSDGDGEKYIPLSMSTIENNAMTMKFDLGKKKLAKKLYLNININDESYKIELIKK